jgi:hypothetical protein
MAQHDYVIANGTGAAVRSDLNNALAAIVSQNSGATEPSPTYAYQFWADTSAGVLKIRNAANNAWITLRELDGTLTMEDGTVSAPGLAFASDLNTGIFTGGADQFNIATNGVERVEFGTSEVVFNDGGANYDFRIEGDTNSSLFFVDASAEAVGIGTTSPVAPLHINSSGAVSVAVRTENSLNVCAVGPGADGNLNVFSNSALPIVFATNAVERARITSDGKLLVGTTSSTGVNSNFAPVIAGNFVSFTGSVSAPTGTATTLFALENLNASYIVTAIITGTADAANYSAVYMVATVVTDSRVIQAIRAGGLLTLSLSGGNVQATQSSGNTQTITWSVTRMANL